MNADAMYQLLEKMLRPGNDGGNHLTTEALLEQLGNNDPQMQLIIRLFAGYNREVALDDLEAPHEFTQKNLNEGDKHESVFIHLEPSAERIGKETEKIYRELQELRQRQDVLAAALGACKFCFGNDLVCRICAGEGQPGWRMPDAQLFPKIIVPALRKLQRHNAGQIGHIYVKMNHFTTNPQF